MDASLFSIRQIINPRQLAFVALLFAFFSSLGQQSNLDSIVASLISTKEDSNKVIKLNSISKQYRISDSKKAAYYGEEALKLAEKINYKIGKGYALNNMGVAYHRGGDYKKSLEYHLKTLKFWESINYKAGIAASLHNIGTVYHVLENFDKALEYNLQAYKIREEVKDSGGIAASLNNIGLVFESKKEYDKALPYHLKTLKIVEARGDKLITSYSLHNIASLYYYLKQYPKAEEFYKKSLELKKENEDLDGIASTCISLGNVYNETGDFKKAVEIISEGIKIAHDIQAKEWIAGGYEALAVSYQKLNNFERAFEYLNLYMQIKDTLLNEETTQQISEMNAKYETEKKDAAIKLLNKEKEKDAVLATAERKRQKLILICISVFLLLVIVSAGFIYRSSLQKQKANRELALKNGKLENAYNVIEIQKHLVEEKHKEITDSINYAERIQRSFIATTELLDHNLRTYFVMFKPKDVVSGDFYWGSKLNNGQFALATADSTGHGVPGAIMSLLNITSLEKAVEHHSDPADILNATRKTIIERLKKDGSSEGGKDGMDCSLLCFDFENKVVKIAAANNPVWIVRTVSSGTSSTLGTGSRGKAPFSTGEGRGDEAELIEITPDKMPVGKHDKDGHPFTTHTIELKDGDIIYTLTDGFPDQFGGENSKKFMSKRLKELLITNSHLPLNEQKQILQTTFKNWIGNLEQVDDVCLIGIRV